MLELLHAGVERGLGEEKRFGTHAVDLIFGAESSPRLPIVFFERRQGKSCPVMESDGPTSDDRWLLDLCNRSWSRPFGSANQLEEQGTLVSLSPEKRSRSSRALLPRAKYCLLSVGRDD